MIRRSTLQSLQGTLFPGSRALVTLLVSVLASQMQAQSTQDAPAPKAASQSTTYQGSTVPPRQPPAQTQVPTTRLPPSREGHPPETDGGQPPHGSGNGGAIAGGIGAAGAAIVIGELIAHEHGSPNHFGHDGPSVPKNFDMNSFSVKGLVGPNWPIVLDFVTDTPGAAQVEILTSDKHHFQATLTNQPGHRAYGIFRLPPNFGSKIQTAVFQVRSAPTAGSNTPAPRLRTFGLGAGEKAVGSVAIDQLTFQPAIIHPKIKEVATYGFHAHSAFDGVRAEFIVTALYNGHILVESDQEEKLPPIPEGERGRGTWQGKGKPGQHMLQVRAWRGLENGGDWVVAWSPDIVDVVK